MLWLLLTAQALAADDACFFPDEGSALACIEPGGWLGSLPVRRSGAVLVRTPDPLSLEALPGVARVEVLPGRGDVARVFPRRPEEDLSLSRQLHGRPEVRWSLPDLLVELVPHELPDDPLLPEEWHLENTGQWGNTPGVDVNAETAWAITHGEGQMVAIIDSGVDDQHPDLQVINGHDYVDDDEDASPELDTSSAGHGTACAGLAAATGDNGLGVAGVAWGAEVYSIRLIGGSTSFGDIYSAFAEAVDAGASVLSNSWGWKDCPDVPMNASIRDAMDYALEEGRGGLGAAVVFAAGNDNCDISEDGMQQHEAVTSVAAINGSDVRESYSSYGSLLDLSAPSGGVLTTDISGDGGYGDWEGDPDYWGGMSGTSAATPIVAGTYALIFAANPRITALQAQDLLCATAERMDVEGGEYDEEGWSPWYGCGRVDAGAAVLAAANRGPGVVEVLGPPAEVPFTRVVLEWSSSDPDGDRLVHELWVRINDDEPVETVVEGTSYDLTGQVEPGDEVAWQVRAVDLWGPGEWSEVMEVRVTDRRARAEVPGGCHQGAPRSGGWWLLGLALWRGRRRR